MSVPATIVDKLRNYEYEKRGCGDAVGDIYALIHHIADLEEEIDQLKASAGINDGGCASRGASDGVIAVDILGRPWVAREGGWWRLMKDVIAGKSSELPQQYAPYNIVHVPAYTPEDGS